MENSVPVKQQHQSPEEEELEKKLQELSQLENRLSGRELDLATLHGELGAFDRRYLKVVGSRFVILDELEAQIAEAKVDLNPEDVRIRDQATEARAKAQNSSKTTGLVQESTIERFVPSEELKRFYREVAKSIHPDLTTDEEERIRRQELMTHANRAYEDGDESALEAILSQWERSPDSVKGEDIAARLIRVIRKISQCEDRLRAIEQEMCQLSSSDLYQIRLEVQKVERKGRDLLSEMALQVDKEIALARKRLVKIMEHISHER